MPNTLKNSLFLLFAVLATIACKTEAPDNTALLNTAKVNPNALSKELLLAVLRNEDTQDVQRSIDELDAESLHLQLDTDKKKMAFWINLYNAHIITALRVHPEYYEPAVRSDFFKKRLISVAGLQLSFAEVEHGLIRKSQWEYGLGYFRTWFPEKFERQNRVNQVDYRAHFALNCGAKDCPPVAVYTPENLETQLQEQTRAYLTKTTIFDKASNTAKVTSLFSWFRGDFGGKNGIRKILKEQKLIPQKSRVKLSYRNYDWSLDLNNYILPN